VEYFSAKPGGPYTIWSGVIAPHIINVGTKCGRVVNFMSRPIYFQEKRRCTLCSPAANGTTIPWISSPKISNYTATSSALIYSYNGVCKMRAIGLSAQI
jgi:hypothetical protein